VRLHDITTLHGEADLRERLAIETEPFPDADRERTGRAPDLASLTCIASRSIVLEARYVG